MGEPQIDNRKPKQAGSNELPHQENEKREINEEKIKKGAEALKRIEDARGKEFPPFLRELRNRIDEDPFYNDKNKSEDEKLARVAEILEVLKNENGQGGKLEGVEIVDATNAEKIAGITTREEMIAYLETIEEIKSISSDLVFDKRYLKNTVEQIFNLGVGMLLNKLPRTDGFREKVKEIMLLEYEKNINNADKIAGIKTREGMIAFLETINGIKGKSDDLFFDAEYLKRTTKEIFDLGYESQLKRVPRTDGFRDKVKEIMLLEKINNM